MSTSLILYNVTGNTAWRLSPQSEDWQADKNIWASRLCSLLQ